MQLLRWIAGITLSLALMVAGARGVGALNVASVAALPQDDHCGRTCWHQIQPDLTTLQEAEILLRADSTISDITVSPGALCYTFASGLFERGCAYSWRGLGSGNDRVEIINLFPRPNMLVVGDVMINFGVPINASLPCRGANANVHFRPNIIAALPSGIEHFTPHAPVSYLSYVPPGGDWQGSKLQLWHGFVRLQGAQDAKYC